MPANTGVARARQRDVFFSGSPLLQVRRSYHHSSNNQLTNIKITISLTIKSNNKYRTAIREA
ncbi:hypothetical protein EGT09_22015 [Pseudomonas putida]|uniref:Uncharacterized protein n=1 Tax=Pseudomonas putida TaxID=303 RepID=A0AAD0L9L4_PSEPU|nr:hypothetical protein C1S65_23065 [Pseudomonas putida]RSC28958.1 hypothetical protein EGT09_22015 [Pseudomonas putida]